MSSSRKEVGGRVDRADMYSHDSGSPMDEPRAKPCARKERRVRSFLSIAKTMLSFTTLTSHHSR